MADHSRGSARQRNRHHRHTIWWNNHSSLIQRVIERLDELHDKVMAGEPSPLEGKVGGIVITGDSDGAQTIIGNLCNFFNGVGLLIPPYATLSVLWDRQTKGSEPTKEELLRKYESDYAGTADRMVSELLDFARPSNWIGTPEKSKESINTKAGGMAVPDRSYWSRIDESSAWNSPCLTHLDVAGVGKALLAAKLSWAVTADSRSRRC